MITIGILLFIIIALLVLDIIITYYLLQNCLNYKVTIGDINQAIKEETVDCRKSRILLPRP